MENNIPGRPLTVSDVVKDGEGVKYPSSSYLYDTLCNGVYLPGVAGASSPELLESCCVQEHSRIA